MRLNNQSSIAATDKKQYRRSQEPFGVVVVCTMCTIVSCNASSLLHFCRNHNNCNNHNNYNHKFPYKCDAVTGPAVAALPLQQQQTRQQQRRTNPPAGSQLGIFPRPIFYPPAFVTSHPVPSLFPLSSNPAVVWLPKPCLATFAKLPQLVWTWVPLVVSLPGLNAGPHLAFGQAHFLMFPR